MLLTSRDKPLYINPAHIVALTPCSSTEQGTIGANCCIYLTNNLQFLVKETMEHIHTAILTGNIDHVMISIPAESIPPEVYPVYSTPTPSKYRKETQEEPHIDTDYATFKAPSRRPRRPQ